ncbi:MAG: DUF6263 family protein [Aurantibacter sp.]
MAIHPLARVAFYYFCRDAILAIENTMKHFYTILFSLFFLGGSYGQTTLQYNLKKDEIFTVKQEAEQIITQELEGTSHVLTNNINGVLEFRVIDEDDNAYNIELTFKDLNMKMTSSLQGELMNVKAKEVVEGDMQSMMFNSLLDSPVNMTLSKTGAILEVIGGDSLVTKMVNTAGLQDEFTTNMMKKSLEKEFGSEALSDSYEQMTFIYSADPVGPGDTWQNEYTGKLNAKNTWTLSGVTNENAEISGTADVLMKIEEPAVTMNLTGTQSTEIRTDIDSGFILKMAVEGLAKGSSTIAQMGDQEIPTNIKSTITYELITE